MVELDFSKGDGLLPAIAQDWQTGEVLMLAFINRESWEETLRSGHATYWSRSRSKLWKKGESSGHVQVVHEIRVDCDDDAVIFKIEQLGGAACHTGHRSCFYRRVAGEALVTEGAPLFDPEKVYKK
jgi:phosphoribosyl-AMP cyclohydrolase